MSRKLLIRSDRFPYHVTVRSNNKELFPLALDHIWKIAMDELYVLNMLYETEAQAFVLMPNHIHLIVTAPTRDLGEIMGIFLSKLTKRINGLSSRSGRIFGGPHFWSIITSSRYYGHAFKYVYRNPVKAGLCTHVEKYKFSTANGRFGLGTLLLPIYFTRVGFETDLPNIDRPNAWLDWLNTPFSKEIELLIQKSLRRKEIKELINPLNRRPYGELSQLI
jgi:putative transposase